MKRTPSEDTNDKIASLRGCVAMTVVELMGVLAIVAVLVSLMLPYYNAFVARARRGEARANVRVISSLQKAYRLDYGSYGTLGSVGYCGGAATCDDSSLENDLGFNPKKCPALRYCYTATASNATATHANGQTGKWVYPRCDKTDTLTLGVKAKNIVVFPDIVKECKED